MRSGSSLRSAAADQLPCITIIAHPSARIINVVVGAVPMMVPGVTRISRALHAGIYREAFTLVEEAGPRNLQPFTRGSARGIKKTSVEIDISVRSCRPIYRSVKAEQGESRLSPRLSPPFFPFGKVRKEMSSTLSIFHKRIPFFFLLEL